jgi:hypothetical protein
VNVLISRDSYFDLQGIDSIWHGLYQENAKKAVNVLAALAFGDTLNLAASKQRYPLGIVFNPVDTSPSTLVSALDLEIVL